MPDFQNIHCDGPRFIDDLGRERIFFGMNLCDKGATVENRREYITEWDEEIFDRFAAAGFNCVRLGTTWEAVEPRPGEYDDEYIASFRATADKLAERGIYFFLDIHQDLWSGTNGGPGDGAPGWANMTDGLEFKMPKLVWAEGYFRDPAVWTCFDNFWRNRVLPETGRGIRDMFCDMLSHLASKLGDCPNLLGWDVFNEPFPGTPGGDIFRGIVTDGLKTILGARAIRKGRSLLKLASKRRRHEVLDELSGRLMIKAVTGGEEIIERFDREFYTPFINSCAAAIRGVTDRGVIFVEGNYWSNTGIPSGVLPPAVGGEREQDFAYTPHGYDLGVDTPLYQYASEERIRAIFRAHRGTQERLDCPVLVGEWGGFSEGDGWLPHIEALLKLFDKYRWSSTYWCYFDGILDSPVMRAIVRPHPEAVCGRIVEYTWSAAKREFRLEFVQTVPSEAPTVINVPCEVDEVVAPGRYEISGGKVNVFTEPGENVIIIKVKEG